MARFSDGAFYSYLFGALVTHGKKTGKKVCLLAYTIRKQLYLSVSIAARLEVTFSLQSSSNIADMSALSVVTRHLCLY